MDFQFSEEQVLFRDTIQRFLTDSFPFEKRQTIIDAVPGYARDHWDTLAELGILALPVSEENGGLSGGAVDTMLVMEQMGKALFTGPYVSSILMSARLLEIAGSPQASTLLEGLIGGERMISFAFAEDESGYDIEATALSAVRNDDGFLLNGRKITVFHADTANDLIVLARTSGKVGESDGLSLFIMPADAEGITMTAYQTQDGNRAADITFSDVQVAGENLIGEEGAAYDAVDEVLDRLNSDLVAEAVGIMWSIYEMTLEYMKTRSQFGETLGSFQALQHRMVDVYMMCEMAQSMAFEAAAACDTGDADQRRRAVSAAKSLVGRYGRKVGQEGIQLHGGIAMTIDYPMGHFFKRLCMIDASAGDVAWHESRYARCSAI